MQILKIFNIDLSSSMVKQPKSLLLPLVENVPEWSGGWTPAPTYF